MQLELISFKLCPYVQPPIITLRHKAVDFKLTYIDPMEPPDWLLEISPTGMVPVLRIDHSDVLMESSVINEFVDDVTSPRLQPDDALQRAQHKGWVALAAACMRDVPALFGSEDAAALEAVRQSMLGKLQTIESELGGEVFFAGAEMSLVDTAWVPFFMRLDLLCQGHDLLAGASLDKVRAWSASLLALPAVQASVVSEFPQMFQGMLGKRASDYAKQLFVPNA